MSRLTDYKTTFTAPIHRLYNKSQILSSVERVTVLRTIVITIPKIIMYVIKPL